MKARIYKFAICLLIGVLALCQNSKAAGSRNINQATGSITLTTTKYINNIDSSWVINIGSLAPVTITYMVYAEANLDYLEVYNIDNSNVETLLTTIMGSGQAINGSITTRSSSGKVKVRVFTSSYNCYPTAGYGFTASFASASNYTSGGSYTFGGNTILSTGKVGINTTQPNAQLEVNAAGTVPNAVLLNSADDMSLIGKNESSSFLNFIGGGSSSGYRPIIKGTRYRGTASNPNALINNDLTFCIAGSGYNGSTVINSTAINTRVDGAVTSTELPQAITFETGKTSTRNEHMRITSSGLVGIGTTTPTSKLHVVNTFSTAGFGGATFEATQSAPLSTDDGSVSVKYTLNASSSSNALANRALNVRSDNYLTGGGELQFQRLLNLTVGSGAGSKTTYLEMIRLDNGTALGTVTNGYGLHIVSLMGNQKWGIYDESGSNWFSSGKIGVGDAAPSAKMSVVGNAAIGYAAGQAAPENGLIINGNVGIGVTAPTCKLDVKGTIRATELKIEDVTKFADFVFEDGYKLPHLTEVSKFIQENGHLPEIPSAKEVKENGLNMAEMQVKLLQKIEELTLYVINQQKEIETLKKALETK